MKITQFKGLLEAAERMYRDGGGVDSARALHDISSLFAGHENKTVATLTALVARVAADHLRDPMH